MITGAYISLYYIEFGLGWDLPALGWKIDYWPPCIEGCKVMEWKYFQFTILYGNCRKFELGIIRPTDES